MRKSSFVAAAAIVSAISSFAIQEGGSFEFGPKAFDSVRGLDPLETPIMDQTCAWNTVQGTQITNIDCEDSPEPGEECVDCGMQPSSLNLEEPEPPGVTHATVVGCNTIARKVGTCWRDPPDYVYYCQNAVVDPADPTCDGSYTNVVSQ